MTLHRQGRLDQARARYLQWLSESPGDVDGLHRLGVVSYQLGDIADAVATLHAATRAAPARHDVWCNLAAAQLDSGAFDDALASCDRALVLNDGVAEAWHTRGLALLDAGRLQPALDSLDRAVALKPAYAKAWSNRGNALHRLQQPDAAVQSYDRALALDPQFHDAWTHRGNALLDRGALAEALASYDHALAAMPRHAPAHHNRALTLMRLGRLGEAVAAFDAAIVSGLVSAGLHHHRAVALQGLHRFEEALAGHDHALAIEPEHLGALCHRGMALQALGRDAEAVLTYGRALALCPDEAAVWNNCGNALRTLGRLEEAVAHYRRALAIEPGFEFLPGTLLFTRMRLCDWAGFDADVAALQRGIEAGQRASLPFPVLSLIDSTRVHALAARTWAQAKHPLAPRVDVATAPAPGQRIRLGYFSADFHEHATSVLLADVLESHDRTRFELVAFSFGPDLQDGMRRRLLTAFDAFIDIRAESDQAAAQRARAMGVHIGVDLKGYTRQARPGLFAARCAPLQVNYLGYPGTLGVRCVDYVLADRTVLPAAEHAHYSEKVVWLPGSYQPNDRHRPLAEPRHTRADLGLPEGAFVFCCFNAGHKLTPATFDVWARILAAVPGSVLWLLQDDPVAQRNLQAEAMRRGVAPGRLIFAASMPLADHLARHLHADLFLDTLPYNAHTTASDALWAGLPVLTCPGVSFPARVAASLLQAVGLPELIAADLAAYEACAITLARDPARLAALRARLVAGRHTQPLFDTPRFTRALEAAYTAMVDRWRAGLPPAFLDIAAPG